MATDSKRTLVPGRGPLSRVPAPAAFLLVLAMFGVGVWVRGPVGAALLGALVLAVAGLLAATWRLLTPGARVLRVLVLCTLVAVTISTTISATISAR